MAGSVSKDLQAAAEALGRYGSQEDADQALVVLLELASPVGNGIYASMSALNAIDSLDAKAAPAAKQIAQLPTQDPTADGRMKGYVPNLIKKTLVSWQTYPLF